MCIIIETERDLWMTDTVPLRLMTGQVNLSSRDVISSIAKWTSFTATVTVHTYFFSYLVSWIIINALFCF